MSQIPPLPVWRGKVWFFQHPDFGLRNSNIANVYWFQPSRIRAMCYSSLGTHVQTLPFLRFFSSPVLMQLSPHSTHPPLPHLLITGHQWTIHRTCLWQRGSQPGVSVLSQGTFGHVRRQFCVGGWCQHLVCRTMEQQSLPQKELPSYRAEVCGSSLTRALNMFASNPSTERRKCAWLSSDEK